MEIQHFSHDHPLVLIQIEDLRRGSKCHVCTRERERIPEAGPIYGCEECRFYLHKSCAELQLAAQIEHPLHPPHPLVLYSGLRGFGRRRVYNCCCCQKECMHFSYHCSECDYNLDLECAALAPTLELQDPTHLLFLFDKVDFSLDAKCTVCGDDFGSHTDQTNSPVFVCAIPQCLHALHLHCAPITLPKTVRHHYHNYHDLLYTRSVTEGGSLDGHFCDTCEEKRNPKFPVYYCRECNFAAHLICGISKELPLLIEAYENDCLQRGLSIEALLRHYEEKLPNLRSEKAKREAELEELRKKIDALEEERVLYEVSKLLA